MLAIFRKFLLMVWYSIAVITIFFAILGVSLKSLNPLINQHKELLERRLGAVLHATIQIKHIEATWRLLGPEVSFVGMSIRTLSNPGVMIEKVTWNLDVFKTLWQRFPCFDDIALSGSTLNVQETTLQHYRLNDTWEVNLEGETAASHVDVLGWLLAQRHFHLAHVTLNLTSYAGVTAALALERVSLDHNTADGLSARVTAHMAVHATGAQKIRKVEGEVTLALWAQFSAHALHFVEADVSVRNFFLSTQAKHIHTALLSGLFLYQPTAAGWLLQGKEITGLPTYSPATPTAFAFEWLNFPSHHALHIDEIDLGQIAAALNLLTTADNKTVFNVTHLQGKARNLDIQIPHDLAARDAYQFSGILDNVSSGVQPGRPTIERFSAAISGSLTNGNFRVFSHNGQIDYPAYFHQPLRFNTLNAGGQWQVTPENLSVVVRDIRLESPTVGIKAAMQVIIPWEHPEENFLALMATYHLTHSAAVLNYLPLNAFDADFSAWLTAAIVDGDGGDGEVLIRGTLHDFPYLHHNGTFLVSSSIKPLQFSFAPAWPTLQEVRGALHFHNQTFSADITARALGLQAQRAQIWIPDYYGEENKTSNPIVYVDLQAHGKAERYLAFLNASPLRTSVGAWLHPFVIQGHGKLQLHLELPIMDLESSALKITGEWLAQKVSFAWTALPLTLKNIAGTIQFTQDSLQASNVQAEYAGTPLTLTLATEKAKESATITALDIQAAGTVKVPMLATLMNCAACTDWISGQSDYHAHVRVPFTTAEYQITLESSLVGVHSVLPAPFQKAAQSAAPLALTLWLNPLADTARLEMNYVKNITASVEMQHYSRYKAGGSTEQLHLKMPTFSWPLATTFPATASLTSENTTLLQSLTAFTLEAAHLSLYNHNFSAVTVMGMRQPHAFLWGIASHEARGQVTVPSKDAHSQPITADFDYLTLESQEKTVSAQHTISATEAAAWPEFFLNIKSLHLGAQNLGAVMLHTVPSAQGIVLQKFQWKTAADEFVAQGTWTTLGKQDKTDVAGFFKTKNVGQFLKEMHITSALTAQAGTVDYHFTWQAAPLNFQWNRLTGNATIQVKNGVIPVSGDAAKMGLGKILSLFSTQSIQRRLQLNFSDFGQTGYSFNSLLSRLQFYAGNAWVKSGVLDGPEAKITFQGRLGLVHKDYALRFVVTPYVTSTLPLIATLAGGPIAGVATYALNKIAAGSINKITAYHYLLLGPWDQPKLIDLDEQVKQKNAAQAARLEEKGIAPAEEARS